MIIAGVNCRPLAGSAGWPNAAGVESFDIKQGLAKPGQAITLTQRLQAVRSITLNGLCEDRVLDPQSILSVSVVSRRKSG